MKRRKRTSRAVPAKGRLKDMADRLWSKAVLSDWNWTCAMCGKEATQAHHLIPRAHQAVRYDLQNGLGLCAVCHIWDANISPHQSAAGFLAWLKDNHPTHHRMYTDSIESGAHKQFTGTTNPQYYCAIIRELKQYVDEEDYTKIVGVKFSQYLETQEKP